MVVRFVFGHEGKNKILLVTLWTFTSCQGNGMIDIHTAVNRSIWESSEL